MPVNPESVIYKEINEFTLKPLIDGLEKIQITREFATTLKTISDFVNNYYNVTHLHQLGSGYYTSTTARAAIPTNVKRRGLVITFETSDGVWSKEQFLGNPTTEWAIAGKWKTLPGDTLQDVGTSTIDTLSQNVISTFFDRQVKDYNSNYIFKGFCLANQAAPSTPSANDVYLYTGSVTATVFGITNVPARNYLVYSGTVWTIVNPYIPKVSQGTGTSSVDTMSQNAISNELNQLATDEAAMVPSIQFNKRVIVDGGSVRNKQTLFDSYKTALDLLPNTLLAYSPEIGLKQSVSGLIYKATKLYNLSSNNNDATQATAANQPYIGGNVAPNERMWLWGNGKEITFTPISFLSTDRWSVSVVADHQGANRVLRGGTSTELGTTTFKNESGTSITFLPVIGLTARYYFVAKGDGTLQLWINGVLNQTLSIATNASFNRLLTTTTGFGNIKIKSLRILNKDLSKSEIEGLDKFLASIYPEHETTAIGSQGWVTSNHLGNVTSDGFIIPEVQGNDAASNAELISGGNFEGGLIGSFLTEPGGVVASYTLNTVNPISGTQDGRIQVTSVGTSNSRPLLKLGTVGFMQAGKRYKIKFDYKVNSGTCILTYVYDGALLNINKTLSGSGTLEFAVYLSANWELALYFDGRNTFDLQIDNPSAKEAGWADAQLLYDTYIGAGRSSLEATKAASMYCKYNNSDDNAAVYGYLYNWFAVYLFSLYLPKGLKIPQKEDRDQLLITAGGSSIAGGKLKKEGFLYWNSPNSGATNETGFSMLGSGFRNADGSFSGLGTLSPIWTATSADATYAHRLYIQASQGSAVSDATDKRRGYALRFLKNAPVAESQNIIRTTGKFPTDIVSGAKSIQIPFGFRVTSIVITSSTNLTNIEAKLFDAAGVERTLLLTQKVCNSTSLIFQVLGDQPILLQDPTVRVTAKGNGGDGMTIDVLATQVIF